MESSIFNPAVPKRLVNVRIDSDLISQAKALKINISQELELHLAEIIAEHKRNSWKEENKKAIENYNQRIKQDGLLSDDIKLF